MPLKKRKVKNKFWIITGLIALLAVLLILKQIPFISEYIFARGISRFYIVAVGHVTSALPFSLFELLIIIAIVLVTVSLIKILKNLYKRKKLKAISTFYTMAIITLCIVNLYVITASFSYNRANNPMKSDITFNNEELKSASTFFLNDFNRLAKKMKRGDDGMVIMPYSFDQLNVKLNHDFSKVPNDNNFYASFTPNAKRFIFSKSLLHLNVSGIFFAPTAEPNISSKAPIADYPYLMAHEIAHSKGIMMENEANLMACYITFNSDDEYIRYSGYMNFLNELIYLNNFMQNKDFYKYFYDNLAPEINREKDKIFSVYNSYNSFFTQIGSFFNDIYLKLSGIKSGSQSYYESPIIEDSGNLTDDGEIIYDIVFNNIQKIIFVSYTKLSIIIT